MFPFLLSQTQGECVKKHSLLHAVGNYENQIIKCHEDANKLARDFVQRAALTGD
ncbi:hypothetical protein BOY45_004384 [Shigella flexneri]|nr:hypothetical protein [Shigella flexneri]